MFNRLADAIRKISSLKFLGRYRYLYLVYLGIALIFFAKLLFSPGAVMGGDWSFPVTDLQIDRNFENSLTTWTYAGNPLGTRQVAPVSIIFATLFKLASLVGLGGAFFPKMLLVLFFALAGANFNLLLRHLKIRNSLAFWGGFLYITTPIFFNYSLMGWLFVILALALLPFFIYLFLQAIENNKIVPALLAALVFSIAAVQSQAIIWYFMALVAILVTHTDSRRALIKNLKFLFIVLGAFALLNAYWLPAMLFLPDTALMDNSLVNTTVSVGTSYRLTGDNILRLWGSLFNYQFENTYSPIPFFVSYIAPFLALVALFFHASRRSRMVIFCFLLYFVPFVFFVLDRGLLAALPFASLIRDIARFAVLSSFAVSVLVIIALEALSAKFKREPVILAGLIVLLLINSSPFWTGRLYSGSRNDFDFRFRTKTWPEAYTDFETQLGREPSGQKAIYLPIGGTISMADDERFRGAFREMADVFAGYSPVPGVVSFSDRNQGITGGLFDELSQAVATGDMEGLRAIVQKANIDYLVARRDLLSTAKVPLDTLLQQAVEQGWAEPYFDQGEIFAVRIKKTASLFSIKQTTYTVVDVLRPLAAAVLPGDLAPTVAKSDIGSMEDLSYLYRILGNAGACIYESQNGSADSAGYDGTILNFIRASKIESYILEQGLSAKQSLAGDEGFKVTAFDNFSITDRYRNSYLTYAPKAASNMRLYFIPSESAEAEAARLILNGRPLSISAAKREGGAWYWDDIEIVEGVNALETEASASIFVVSSPENLNVSDLAATPAVYQRYSATSYKVSFTASADSVLLGFNESFNGYWRLQLVDKNNPKIRVALSSNAHRVVDGYANGWLVTQDDLSKAHYVSGDNVELVLEFVPQRYFIWGGVVSLGSLLAMAIYLFAVRRKKHVA